MTTDQEGRNRKIRVLLAKPGLDGHDRGIKVVGRALRDAGMDVIYAGLHQTPEQIIHSAIDEDVDVIGLSNLSGSCVELFTRITSGLKERGINDVLVIGGGITRKKDIEKLNQQGIAGFFGPASNPSEIVTFIREHVRP
jgi:methylmalonyl-CoA mutase C-terminal domain/subunit